MDKQTWINGIRGFIQMAKNHLNEEEFDQFLDEVDDEVAQARPSGEVEEDEGDIDIDEEEDEDA